MVLCDQMQSENKAGRADQSRPQRSTAPAPASDRDRQISARGNRSDQRPYFQDDQLEDVLAGPQEEAPRASLAPRPTAVNPVHRSILWISAVRLEGCLRAPSRVEINVVAGTFTDQRNLMPMDT